MYIYIYTHKYIYIKLNGVVYKIFGRGISKISKMNQI